MLRYFITVAILLVHSFFLLSYALIAQNTPPQIAELLVGESDYGTITIGYQVFDQEGDSVFVQVFVSEDGINYVEMIRDSLYEENIFPWENPVQPGEAQHFIDVPNNLPFNPQFIRLLVDDHQDFDIQSLVNQVDSSRLLQDLGLLTANIRHHDTNPVHLEATKDFIENTLANQGLTTWRQAFAYSNYDAHNIIGRKNGLLSNSLLTDTTFIIDAHFDTVEDSPGADDNGSGVVGVLEAARILAPHHFDFNIDFIGFDFEEGGLIGSHEYVFEGGIPDDEFIGGVLNFEMIGYYTNEPNTQVFPIGFSNLFPEAAAEVVADDNRGNFITNVANPASEPLKEKFNNCAATYVPELRVISLSGTGSTLPDLRRSDHANFWDDDYQALMLTDGANFRNPNYHDATDTLGSINFTFMTHVVQASIATIAELAGIRNATSKEAPFTDAFSGILSTNAFSNSFQIIQNPVGPYIELQFDEATDRTLTLELLDMNGKKIRTNQLNKGIQNFRLENNDLKAGLYILKVGNGKEQCSKKVVVR